jgi:hypothetical protein
MSYARPLVSGEGGEALRLLAASVRRRAAAASQLALQPEHLLSERDLIAARERLAANARAIEDALRVGLADRFADHDALHAVLSSGHVPIAEPILERSRAWCDGPLLAAVLIDVEASRARDNSDRASALLPPLIRDDDAAVAAAAMGLLVARSRRLGGGGGGDLSADVLHRLTWTIAAALRLYMIDRHGIAAAAADEAVAAEASAYLASHDEGDALEAHSLRLVRALSDAERLTDDWIAAAVDAGELHLFIAALAERTGLRFGAVADVLTARDPEGLVLLLRAGGIERRYAGAILARHGRATDAALAARVDLFDATEIGAAGEALLPWRLDAAYRAALTSLSGEPR